MKRTNIIGSSTKVFIISRRLAGCEMLYYCNALVFLTRYVVMLLLCFRENDRQKKDESELESEWDDIGSAFAEVHKMSLGSQDDDLDLDIMVV